MLKSIYASLVFAISAIIMCAYVNAAEPSPLTSDKIAKIDALVEDRMAALKIPGVAIALIEDGEIVHAKGFGVTNIGGPPVTEHTPFQTGSVSKSFTALAVMQLVEQGRLDLDDPVVKYLPEFQSSNKTVSDTITVRHLLSHRSGFSIQNGNRNQDGGGVAPDEIEKAVRELASMKLKYAPGETFEYSNSNYQILGHLLETLTGQSYESQIETQIMTPERMPNSYVGRGQDAASGAAQGYRYWFGQPRAFEDDTGRATLAQGGINASANDLAVYLKSYMSVDEVYVSQDSINDMITPYDREADRGYGLAWQVRTYPDYRLIFHSGSSPGFNALAGFSPDAKFGFVVLLNTNSSFGTRDTGSLRFGVANIMMDRGPPPLGPDLVSRIMFGLLCIFPFILAGFIFGFWWKYKADEFKPLTSGKVAIVLRVVLPSLVLLALACLLFVIMPSVNGAPMSAVMLFAPDIGWLIIIGGSMALVWGFVRPVLRLRKR